MKKINAVVLGLIVTMGLSSCIKDNVQPDDSNEKFEEYRKERLAIETPLIKAFLEENELVATEHDATGIWYILESAGQGDHKYYSGTPPYSQYLQTKLVVKYTGRLLNGEVFAQVTEPDPMKDHMFLFSDPYLQINGVIQAWQYAFLPAPVGGLLSNGLQKGAKIRIITPSPYAYGDKDRKDSKGEVTIPANSVLDFSIEVVELSDPNN